MGLFDKLKKAFLGETKEEKEEEKKVKEEPAEEIEDPIAEDVVTEELATTEETKEEEAQALETEEKAEEVLQEKEESSKEPQEPKETSELEETEEEENKEDASVKEETEEQVEEVVSSKENTEVEEEPKEVEEKEEEIPSIAKEVEETLEEVSVSEETIIEEEMAQEAATGEELAAEEAVEEKEETQDKYEHGLEKTRKTFGERLNALLANFRRVDEDFFEELEDTLITSDVGFQTALQLTDTLRDEVKLQNAKKPAQVQNVIIEKMVDLYEANGSGLDSRLHFAPEGPTIFLFVGVNGAGKTTTIGKLAHQMKSEGKKVLLAAADTFRAGAIHQLEVWGERAGVEVVAGQEGGDPSAVVFDAVEKAKAENYDVLLVDTAGRLQNKVNLMNELAKMKRIIQRELPEAPQEVLLVLDATTGQNALSQAKQFNEATELTGLVLTKLDGTAKGGIVLAIRNELKIPVKLVGLGEKITDLSPFDAEQFAYGLFKGLWKED
ncbi:signal recognition particle-docking protein FtsY [Catellicoccus marimammalium]|uniref:Signal recognition particle receptor FtsY n=1 Tax=Catellicoccus marimammalium M35/04/3 TaxID=1234409 RepID=K8ZAM2_9ENTE|nr:signal recognition particle-docking protein FtsY [Catellicoccus marimammalium]EKU27037.1 Signal recognition particle receptor protein FtsY (alpha subunit) [Catellicoccus marimammalium M35/04/3]